MTYLIDDYRNPVYNEDTSMVDLEIHHVVHGWLPSSIPPTSQEPEHIRLLAFLDINNLTKVSEAISDMRARWLGAAKERLDTAMRGEGITGTDSSGREWNLDADSLRSLNTMIGLSQLVGVPSEVVWRESDGTEHTLTAGILASIASVAATRERVIYAKYQALVDSINDATTKAILEAIVIPDDLED